MTLTGHGEAVHLGVSPDAHLATGLAKRGPGADLGHATGKIERTLPKQNVLSLAFNPSQVLGVGGRNQGRVGPRTGQSVFKRRTMAPFHIAFLPRTLLMIGKRAGPFQNKFGPPSFGIMSR
jgi:hypothetical protein